jgi:peroxiredoxin
MQRFLARLPFGGQAWLPGLALLLAIQPAAAQRKAVQPIRSGEPFPAGTYKLFNPKGDEIRVDLADVLGKKTVVLVYWIPGNPRAEAIFTELLELTREIDPAKLVVYGVAVANPSIGVTPDVILERAVATGVDVPILNDEGFAIGQRLSVRSVPHISIIDRSGRLKLSNGASLSQDLEYKVDLRSAILRVADSGELYEYGFLPTYYPVKELEGQPSPDFTASAVQDGEERRWSALLDSQKVNVLVFWSIGCPHCRRQLPEINRWLVENPGRTNLIGCATVTSEKEQAATREFCRENELVFPNLFDQDAQVSQLYGVTSTPTIVVVGPNGVVDSAITSSVADFGSAMERKQRELLSP